MASNTVKDFIFSDTLFREFQILGYFASCYFCEVNSTRWSTNILGRFYSQAYYLAN